MNDPLEVAFPYSAADVVHHHRADVEAAACFAMETFRPAQDAQEVLGVVEHAVAHPVRQEVLPLDQEVPDEFQTKLEDC